MQSSYQHNHTYDFWWLQFSIIFCLFCILVTSTTLATSDRDSAKNHSEKNIVREAVHVPSNIKPKLLRSVEDSDLEIKLKPSTIIDQKVLPLQIVVKPADAEVALADQNLPGGIYVPEGSRAYKIIAISRSGATINDDQIKDTFMLGLSYPKHIPPEAARNLRLFILSGDRWLPVESRLDVSQRMVKTETAQQFGIYRLLAQADTGLQGVFVYPNPVQFGEFGGVSKSVKFGNVPLGSVIQVYTVTGEQIREIEVNTSEASWDGKKGNGDIVTSGLYIYRVQMVGKEAFGKIAVLR